MNDQNRSLALMTALAVVLSTAQACAGPSPNVPASADPAAGQPLTPLNSAVLRGRTDQTKTDRDRDGVPDATEVLLGSNPDVAEADGDGDGIPDALEASFGTDPTKRDSDGDGLSDLYEHLNPHPEHRSGYTVLAAGASDSDGDGLHNALDADGNNNGVPDGQEDWDGDGVPNGIEPLGYYWDKNSQSFKLAQYGDGIIGFKTDPTLISSDMDPYTDGLEAKRQVVPGMGELHPCKAMMPQIVVDVTQISWTPNGTITMTDGSSISEGTSDATSSQHTTSSSTTDGSSESVTTNVGTEMSATPKISASVSSTVSVNHSDTISNSTSTTVSSSTSRTEAQNWSQATSTNLSSAANLTLHAKFANIGTLGLNNVNAFLDVKLGDSYLFTVQVGAKGELKSLTPSGTGAELTINSNSNGQPLSLSLDQLKALKMGAPLTITLSGLSGDAYGPKVLDNGQIAIQTLGPWDDYYSSIHQNTAELMLDDGEGHVRVERVYAPLDASGPEVTLLDAYLWAFNARIKNNLYQLRPNTTSNPNVDANWRTIEDWAIFLTNDAFDRSQAEKDQPNMPFTMRVYGQYDGSLAKVAPPPDATNRLFPRLVYANFDEKAQKMDVVAHDFVGVKSVELRGAKDFYDTRYTPKPPSPLFNGIDPVPNQGFMYYHNAAGIAKQGFYPDYKLFVTHENAVTSSENWPMALRPINYNPTAIDGQTRDMTTMGWTIDKPAAHRFTSYAGPEVRVYGDGDYFILALPSDSWAKIDERYNALKAMAAKPGSNATLNAHIQKMWGEAQKEYPAILKRSQLSSEDRYAIVVTNTRGNVAVFDTFGNLLRQGWVK